MKYTLQHKKDLEWLFKQTYMTDEVKEMIEKYSNIYHTESYNFIMSVGSYETITFTKYSALKEWYFRNTNLFKAPKKATKSQEEKILKSLDKLREDISDLFDGLEKKDIRNV